jgi:hypothetical protein
MFLPQTKLTWLVSYTRELPGLRWGGGGGGRKKKKRFKK